MPINRIQLQSITFTNLQETFYNFNSPIGLQKNEPEPSELTTSNVDLNSLFATFYSSNTLLLCEDDARELKVVDELVRSCAQNLPNDWQDDSSLASSSTVASSPRSDTSFTSSYSSATDVQLSPSKKNGLKTDLKISRGRSHGTEDKKYRKKEQNKNAANRYRQKKKTEIGLVLEEEKELEKKNSDLTTRLADVRRELKCLKSLMREFFRKQGLLEI